MPSYYQVLQSLVLAMNPIPDIRTEQILGEGQAHFLPHSPSPQPVRHHQLPPLKSTKIRRELSFLKHHLNLVIYYFVVHTPRIHLDESQIVPTISKTQTLQLCFQSLLTYL